jgi:hypothetical protein
LNNSNADEIPIWGGLHESIQWVLYMPVVFGLSFAFSFLFNLLSNFRGDFEGIFLYLQTPLNAGLMATLFVWLGLNLAPRVPRICAWVLYSIWSVFILLTIFRFVAIVFFEESMSIQQSNVIELLQSIGWLAAGIFFLLRWGKQFAPAQVASNNA